jgi:hypothetical protein
LEFFNQQINTIKFINIYRPIIILLDKILQSGAFNNNNFSTFLNEIFFIADSICKKCLNIINNIQLETQNINNNNYDDNDNDIYIPLTENYNYDRIYNLSNLEAKKYNESLSLSYKKFYFW